MSKKTGGDAFRVEGSTELVGYIIVRASPGGILADFTEYGGAPQVSIGTGGVSIHQKVSGIGFNRQVHDGAIYNPDSSAWQLSARDAYFALEGYNGAVTSWAVTKAGNVGIGTLAPQAKLHVQGDIIATGDIVLQNADCAEEFAIIDCEGIEPGTVMVLGEEGSLRQSTEAYDKKVAGVISGAGDLKPGLILDKQPESTESDAHSLNGQGQLQSRCSVCSD